MPSGKAMLVELGEMTINGGLSRRRAISALAKKYHLAPNELYETLEEAKKLV